jgi:hypothetical protein
LPDGGSVYEPKHVAQMDQSAKLKLDQADTRSMKTGRGVRQGYCLSPILWNLCSEYLAKEALEGFGGFEMGGLVIRIVKYADDLVLLAKKEGMLQGVIGRLIEIVRCYGMEMYVGKTQVMRISRQPSLVQNMVDQKQSENVECFSYLDSIMTSDARCTHEIKSSITMEKASFKKKSPVNTNWT